jgi:hypothetical protein
MSKMIEAEQAVEQLGGLGFDRVNLIHGSTYKDSSTLIIIPTRGQIDSRVVQSWQNMLAPMNQKRAIFFARGHEVGTAYNEMIKNILGNSELAKWKYVLTLEDDNLIPSDAHIRLLESIDAGPFDAVGGLYFTKGDINMPMAYGDPGVFARTGVLEFAPRNIVQAVSQGMTVEVNGIAMGCSLYRLDLFKEFSPPWFVTVNDIIPDKGPAAFTQDLWFCERAKRAGKRFAVDCRVRVGHLDINTGLVY